MEPVVTVRSGAKSTSAMVQPVSAHVPTLTWNVVLGVGGCPVLVKDLDFEGEDLLLAWGRSKSTFTGLVMKAPDFSVGSWV